MNLRHDNGLDYYQFDLMVDIPRLKHGIFTRRNGASSGPFNSLNVGLAVGDSAAEVTRNRKRISKCLGDTDLQFIKQVHGDYVLLVNPEFPDSYWSGKYSLPMIRKRTLLPPLGLITVAALLPRDWEFRLVDLNAESYRVLPHERTITT